MPRARGKSPQRNFEVQVPDFCPIHLNGRDFHRKINPAIKPGRGERREPASPVQMPFHTVKHPTRDGHGNRPVQAVKIRLAPGTIHQHRLSGFGCGWNDAQLGVVAVRDLLDRSGCRAADGTAAERRRDIAGKRPM